MTRVEEKTKAQQPWFNYLKQNQWNCFLVVSLCHDDQSC